jgi:phosphohistidine swiveling domain-containing protein
MGTGIATQRIVSGQLVTVDGDAGVVILSASNPVTAGGVYDPKTMRTRA